jgi:hypothetical protein
VASRAGTGSIESCDEVEPDGTWVKREKDRAHHWERPPEKNIITLGAHWTTLGAIERGAKPELGGEEGEVGNEVNNLQGMIRGSSGGGREASSDRSTSKAPQHRAQPCSPQCKLVGVTFYLLF